MSKEKTTIKRRRRPEVRANEAGRIKLYVIMVLCLLGLSSGFFLAARQHFSTMDYGMRNSKLRKQLDDLEAEKKRLLLAREVSLSPAEVRKSAKKLGIMESDASGVQLAAVKNVAAPTGRPEPASTKSGVHSTDLVQRTAYVSGTTRPRFVETATNDKASRDKKPRLQMSKIVASR